MSVQCLNARVIYYRKDVLNRITGFFSQLLKKNLFRFGIKYVLESRTDSRKLLELPPTPPETGFSNFSTEITDRYGTYFDPLSCKVK